MDERNVRKEVDAIAEQLGDVLKIDIDAVEAYNEAIEKVEAQELRSRLSAFRDDHQRHISELQSAIQDMGHEPPEIKPDLKGKLIEGMTALRSSMGDEQALKAMRQNETITNRTYEKALQDHTYPGAVQRILQAGLEDERRHLQWIEQQLSVTVGAQEQRY